MAAAEKPPMVFHFFYFAQNSGYEAECHIYDEDDENYTAKIVACGDDLRDLRDDCMDAVVGFYRGEQEPVPGKIVIQLHQVY
jgi:hypothetical protein